VIVTGFDVVPDDLAASDRRVGGFDVVPDDLAASDRRVGGGAANPTGGVAPCNADRQLICSRFS